MVRMKGFRVKDLGKRIRNLIEDEHRVESVEGVGVKVLDLAGQARQTSEGGHKVSRLHPSSVSSP